MNDGLSILLSIPLLLPGCLVLLAIVVRATRRSASLQKIAAAVARLTSRRDPSGPSLCDRWRQSRATS